MHRDKHSFANPVHPYTKALISSVLDMDLDGEKTKAALIGDVASPIDPPAGCRFCTRCPMAVKECCQMESPQKRRKKLRQVHIL